MGVYASKYSPDFAIVGADVGQAGAVTGEVRLSRTAPAEGDTPEIIKAVE
jgi:hypothetical protein